jgi:hypothetical protein
MSNPYPKHGATHDEGSSFDPPSTPYGPHPHGVDEAAGGADSSPYETASSGERQEIAEKGRAKGHTADNGDERRPSG